MSVNFDMFGNPVRPRRGERGRPKHEKTPERVNKIKLGLALGWSNERIANGIACSVATLKLHYKAELQERLMARDQMDLRRFELIMAEANKGNVGAIKELGRMIERNDSVLAGKRFDDAQKDGAQAAAKARQVGKKEAAQIAAETAGGEGSLWADDLTPGFDRPN